VVHPSFCIPDFGRFCRSRGCGLRAAKRPCSPKTSLVADATDGFTHGRVGVLFVKNPSHDPAMKQMRVVESQSSFPN